MTKPTDVSECRKCSCRDIRVLWTYRAADGSIRRRRICRNCGLEFTTIERRAADIYDDDWRTNSQTRTSN